MLPSRGNCHAVFLLNRAAHMRRPATREEWVKVAQRQSTYMASALDLASVAERMVGLGLANILDSVKTTQALKGLAEQADRPTLVGIARLLFEWCPPHWLEHVISNTGIAIEYIPTPDLQALEWLDGDLEGLLRDAASRIFKFRDEEFRKRLGDAAEVVVVASKEMQGLKPIHVARISDSFGYDIEVRRASGIDRIEVKGAVSNTAGSFFISRNEYEKSLFYGDQWLLVQVVFLPSVLVKNSITSADIQEVKMLSAKALSLLVPADTESFVWAESGKVSPPKAYWNNYPLGLDPRAEIELLAAV